MSIKLMDKVWELQSLSQPRKMLLLSIADYASDEGVAWPAVKTLMRKCSLKSESGTRRAISELVELGWLTKQERPRKERKGKHQQDTNLYQINLVKLYEEAALYEPVLRAPSKLNKNEPAHGDGSQHDGLRGDKNGDYEPVPRTPDPSLNLKHDPSDKNSSSEHSGECPDGQLEGDFLAKHPTAVVFRAKKRQWGSQEDLTCAEWLWGKIIRLYEQAAETDGELVRPKEPNWTVWANEVRLMCTLDGRTHRQICELFGRVNRDPFWCQNILSPSKLREKWDDLTLRLSGPGGAAATSGRPELDFTNTDWIYGIEDKLRSAGVGDE